MRAISWAILILVGCVPFVGADDRADIEALVEEYNRTEESGDLTAQSKLMSADRVWVNGAAGRRTDQALNMELQQAGINEGRKRIPGMKNFFEIRDLLIKTYENTAIASFYWFRNRVYPADYDGPTSQPGALIQTLVFVKLNGEWKIVHSHASPLFP